MNSKLLNFQITSVEKKHWTKPSLVSISLGDAESGKALKTATEGQVGLKLAGPTS